MRIGTIIAWAIWSLSPSAVRTKRRWCGSFSSITAREMLDSHENEIGSALNTQLIWERLNNNKSSNITIRMEGVSVTNETDWTRMAKFHAEWSKKMCDVILPYLSVLYPTVELTNR